MGEQAAIRLLNVLLPTGPVPVHANCVALAVLPRLGSFRPKLLKWLVLVHEASGCWDNLQQTIHVLFFLLKDETTVADASFALLRLCYQEVPLQQRPIVIRPPTGQSFEPRLPAPIASSANPLHLIPCT